MPLQPRGNVRPQFISHTQGVKAVRLQRQVHRAHEAPNISPNKVSYNAKRLESQKSIWKILKRRNSRVIRKSEGWGRRRGECC